MDEHEFSEFIGIMKKAGDDKQRTIRLRAVLNDQANKLNCKQVDQVIKTFLLSDGKVEAAVAMYRHGLADPDAFLATINGAFKFQEERDDVKSKLGL